MRALLFFPAAVLLAACGGVRAPDLQTWDTTTAALTSTVQTYQQTADAAPSRADCAAARDGYLGQMQPGVHRLDGIAGDMDGCFQAMRQAGMADATGLCGSMRAELDQYGAAGCSSDDPATNQAEIRAHCQRMLGYLGQLSQRAGAMHDMTSHGMMAHGMCSP